MANELTVDDVLTMLGNLAQQCREMSEGDMRYITGRVRQVREMLNDGKTRAEILAAFDDD